MPRIKLQGYFHYKESMKVTAANVTTGWLEGTCFELASGVAPYSKDEVNLCNTAGEFVYGIALEGSAEHASIYSGMNIPSSSKVTLLHGHSKFQIDHVAEVAAGTLGAAYKAYETVCESATIGNYLYTSANGKLTTASGSAYGNIDTEPPFRVGVVTIVPTATNYFTLGVLLFG